MGCLELSAANKGPSIQESSTVYKTIGLPCILCLQTGHSSMIGIAIHRHEGGMPT